MAPMEALAGLNDAGATSSQGGSRRTAPHRVIPLPRRVGQLAVDVVFTWPRLGPRGASAGSCTCWRVTSVYQTNARVAQLDAQVSGAYRFHFSQESMLPWLQQVRIPQMQKRQL